MRILLQGLSQFAALALTATLATGCCDYAMPLAGLQLHLVDATTSCSVGTESDVSVANAFSQNGKQIDAECTGNPSAGSSSPACPAGLCTAWLLFASDGAGMVTVAVPGYQSQTVPYDDGVTSLGAFCGSGPATLVDITVTLKK